MFYFGVDLTATINGSGLAPALVLSLVWRLPDDSLTVALMRGSREHFGWGVDRHLTASIYDAINLNTRATGQYEKGKAPKIPAWPRPKEKAAPTKKKVTVKDLWHKLSTGG